MNNDRPNRFERFPSFRATVLDTSLVWQERLAAQQEQRQVEAVSAKK